LKRTTAKAAVRHYAFSGSNPGRGLPMMIYSCRVEVITFKPDGGYATTFRWSKDKGDVKCKRCLHLLASRPTADQ